MENLSEVLSEVIFHLKVIEIFLSSISALLAGFFIMVAFKYKGIL